MPRKPAMTSLLNGQAVNVRFGSTSVTCSLGLIFRNARAQAAPPKPPPITTMRAADCARDGEGKANDAAVAAMPRTTFLRVVIRRSASMNTFSEDGAAATGGLTPELRFRSSQAVAATSDANFGIKGALATYDSSAALNSK